MMWGKRDSDNLESIAKSLEKLVEREQERQLIESTRNDPNFFERTWNQMLIKDKPVRIHDGNKNLADEILDEELKATRNLQNKMQEARNMGNMPFFPEALLDEDEEGIIT